MFSWIWNYIQNFGSLKAPEADDASSLLNRMVVMGMLVASLLVVTSYWTYLSTPYLLSTGLIGAGLISIPILNQLKLYNFSKAYTVFIFPLFISGSMVCIGGNFSEHSIFTVIFFLIFIFYEKSPKMKIAALSFLGFHVLGASIYLYIFPPLFGIHDFPYDNFLVFAICVIWLIMVLGLYSKRLIEEKEKQAQLIETLSQKNTHLRQTTEALEQFTYIASHDLKSPVQTILSFSQLIEKDLSCKSYDALYVKIDFIKTAAEQARRLITDILEFSRIQEGEKGEKEPVDFSHLVEKVQLNLTDLIQEKRAQIYTDNLTSYKCRESEMSIVFQNLIENGIKYNESETPTISIHSFYEFGFQVLEFKDNGIGIDAAYFDKIFEFFKRLHTQDTYDGTGLGLGLCRKIVEGMGGKIEVESTPGEGSTFRVFLPLEPVAV